MGELFILDHPLIQHKLTYIRDEKTGTKQIRDLVNEVSMLMGFEITLHVRLQEIEVKTPLTTCKAKVLSGKKIGLIPILRAGLGMVDGMLQLLPAAKVGHIGLYRDPETFNPIEYYAKLPPDISERKLIVLDPMLATGGSANDAIDSLKKYGGRSIKLMCLVAAPEGIEVIQKNHPDVDIYLGALDEGLNEKGYIVPGLGDAGDRLFGTK